MRENHSCLAGELNPDLKANLNGHSSICYLIGLKSYIFMENDKISSLRNLFQYLLSTEILSERKIEFILPYLVRNFQISARNKLQSAF